VKEEPLREIIAFLFRRRFLLCLVLLLPRAVFSQDLIFDLGVKISSILVISQGFESKLPCGVLKITCHRT
jgi:hypothetical protein